LTVGHAGECEEAILRVTSQKRTVLQRLDALDDLIAMGQEEAEKFDMCLKRHLGG
jgi:flagellar biosynthesis/type III secretory pathway chaperone